MPAAVQRRSMAADRLAGCEAASAEKSWRARMLKQWPTIASLTSPVLWCGEGVTLLLLAALVIISGTSVVRLPGTSIDFNQVSFSFLR